LRAIAERIRRMHQLQELIECGRACAGKSPAVRERLDDHHLAFSHVTRALETVLHELEVKHERAASNS
jgi:hypothetical protein